MNFEHRKKLMQISKTLSKWLLELTPDLKTYEINKVDDKELSGFHSTLHNFWNKIDEGKPVEDWDKSKIKSMHIHVVRELIKRNFQHSRISDLDDSLPGDLKKKSHGFEE